MAGKLLFRIEDYFDKAWHPLKVRLLVSHNFARFVEWHDALDVAIEYAKREIEAAKARNAYSINPVRVTDHLGNVHWRNTDK